MSQTRRPTSPLAEEILGLYFPVLDHGFVSLVDYMGTDECIEARAARVSYGYGTAQTESNSRAAPLPAQAPAHDPERDGRVQISLLDADVRRAAMDSAPLGQRQ